MLTHVIMLLNGRKDRSLREVFIQLHDNISPTIFAGKAHSVSLVGHWLGKGLVHGYMMYIYPCTVFFTVHTVGRTRNYIHYKNHSKF